MFVSEPYTYTYGKNHSLPSQRFFSHWFLSCSQENLNFLSQLFLKVFSFQFSKILNNFQLLLRFYLPMRAKPKPNLQFMFCVEVRIYHCSSKKLLYLYDLLKFWDDIEDLEHKQQPYIVLSFYLLKLHKNKKQYKFHLLLVEFFVFLDLLWP